MSSGSGIKSKLGTYDGVEKLIRKRVGRGGKLLEIAGGAGMFCEKISDLFGLTVTSDILPPRDPRAGAAVCFDANHRFPFKAGTLDVVVCIEGIEHLDAQVWFLSECARVLKRGGWLVMSTPNIVSLDERRRFFLEGVSDSLTPEIREGRAVSELDFFEMHIGLMHPLVFRMFLGRAGFETVEESANFLSRRPRHFFQLALMRIHLWLRRRKYKAWNKPFPADLERLNSDPLFLYGNSLITLARKI